MTCGSESTGSESNGPVGRAVVTFARSWQALAAVRSLGRRGVEVIAADEYRLTPSVLSRFSSESFVYPSPVTDPDGFAAAMDEAIDRFASSTGPPLVVLPVHRETYELARRRERFADRVAMPIAPSDRIEQVRDKALLVELARQLDIAVPATWMPETADEIGAIARQVELPAVVKMRTGSAGVGLEYVDDAEELETAFEAIRREHRLGPGDLPIVQQRVAGADYCVGCLFDHGEARASFTYRNVRTLTEGGPGVVRRTVSAPAAEAAARRLLETLEWHGAAELDFVWTGEEADEPYLIEVNPRLFSRLFQAIASGLDLPWLLYRLAVDGEIETQDRPRLGVQTETPLLGLVATLREAAESDLTLEDLGSAWAEAKRSLETGGWAEAWKALIGSLDGGLDLEGRLDLLRRLVEERQETLSELMASEDPTAAIGLLYPLAVFLRHGEISTGLLVGATPGTGPEPSGGAGEGGGDES